MIRHHLVALIAVVAVPIGQAAVPASARAQSPRQSASGRRSAREIVENAASALGGVDRLRAIAGVRVEEAGREVLLTIPGSPAGPLPFSVQAVHTLARMDPMGMRRTVEQTFPTRAGHFLQTTVAVSAAASAARSGGDVTAATPFDLRSAMEDLALAPSRIVLTALDAPSLRLDDDTTIGTTRYHRVSFALNDGHVQVLIGDSTWFPERVRLVRVYPDLVYWAMWGEITVETVWSAWSLEPSGVWYPRQRSVTFNGQPFREYIVTALDLAAATPPDSFGISDSIAARFASAAAAATHAPDPQLTPVTLAGDIVLFQGGYQAAIVREPDGVIVIEAPESDAKSRAVLSRAAQLFPGVPILAVVTTSPQWMHIAGLPEYARRGIPIYALDANVPELHALLAAPRGASDGSRLRRARVVPVHHPVTLGSGTNALRLIPARGVHGRAMMLVYWPAHHLLYASDMIIPPTFEPVFTSAYASELASTVKRLGLEVSTLYALHLPSAPWPLPVANTPAASLPANR